jgi:hypothetical protein
MRKWFFVLSVSVLAACGGSSETSPVGPVGGTVNIRKILPPAVESKAPPDDKAAKHELPVDVHGVKAKVVWHTFDDGPNKYIVSYAWEVVTPAAGITLEPIGQLNPINSLAPDAVVESEIVRVRWHDNTSSGTHLGEQEFQIDATGSGKPM